MIAFLTSSPFREDTDRPTFSNENGFVDRIRQSLLPYPRCVFVCSDPDNHGFTCRIAADIFMAFAHAGIHFSGFQVLDGRNAEKAGELVGNADLIVLAGGHVPTQHAFFRSIELRKLLHNHPGVVMGISAGSMNCADTVYTQPEEAGESAPEFLRFRPGLGLTKVQILPHYQKVKDYILDGKRLFEDITYADSQGQTFYALPDFSYIVDDGAHATLFGEGYCLQSGMMTQIAGYGKQVTLY